MHPKMKRRVRFYLLRLFMRRPILALSYFVKR